MAPAPSFCTIADPIIRTYSKLKINKGRDSGPGNDPPEKDIVQIFRISAENGFPGKEPIFLLSRYYFGSDTVNTVLRSADETVTSPVVQLYDGFHDGQPGRRCPSPEWDSSAW